MLVKNGRRVVECEEGLVHSSGKGTMEDGGRQTMRYLRAE